MRALIFSAAALASGCCCNVEIFGEDECSDDSQCAYLDDGVYCNGYAACQPGFLSPQRCRITEPDCFYGEFCDESSSACVVCEGEHDSPDCPSDEPDAGGFDPFFPDAGMCEQYEASCDECAPGLECFAATTVRAGAVEITLADRCSITCDPTGLDGACGACAVCNDIVRIGNEHVAAADVGRPPFCATPCYPRLTSSGCSRDGMSCDVATGTCQDACTSDAECNLITDDAGALVEDPAGAHHCDSITGRCRSLGTPDADVSDHCASDTDCPADGVCLRGDGWPAEGHCTRLDCNWGGSFACAFDEICHYGAHERPICVIACTIGAEPLEDRLGVRGHGDTCWPGLSCRRSDGPTADLERGGCVPGNYNAVTESNIGERCTTDEECYSPYGLGRCAWSDTGVGTCTVLDCGTRLSGLCDGDDETCATWDGPLQCLRECLSADDCAAGNACASTRFGQRVCAPSCTSDMECRTNEVCEGTDCTFEGACRCQPT